MKITFIEHSGFLVELEKCALLFDYYQGVIPKMDKEKDLYVFASHAHHDHFNPDIFNLENTHPNVTYILSNDIKVSKAENRCLIGIHENLTVKDISIETLRSTDEGVAFFVEVEGKQIYHAGDLNWWHWNGEPEEDNAWMERVYKEELETLRGKALDVAFVLLDPRQEDKYCLGMNYFLENIKVKTVFPMHAFGKYGITKHYLNCDDGRKYQGIVQEIKGANQEFQV